MEKYPKELVYDVADSFVPDRYRKFFDSEFFYQGKNVGKYMDFIGYKGLTYYFFIEDIINKHLKGATTKKEFLALSREYYKNLSRKRNALHKDLTNLICNLKVSVTDNPIYEEAKQLDEIESEKLVKKRKKELDDWLACEGKFAENNSFIDCPYFGWTSKTIIKNSFKSDIIGAILNYVKTNLAGELTDYFIRYAKEYIGKPLFAPTGYSVQLQKVQDDIYGYEVKDNSGLTILKTAYMDSEPLDTPRKVLSSDAKDMLSYLSSQVTDLNKFASDGEVDVSAHDLAKLYCHGNPSGKYLDRIESVLHELFSWYYFNKGLGYHYIDRITPYDDKSGYKRYIISLGDVTKKAIIEHKYIRIKKSDYEKLENPLCLIIAHFLKSEQILLYPYEDSDRCENKYIRYDYKTWLQNVNFQSRSKSDNFILLAKALQEFKDKEVIIQDFVRRQDDFLIKFICPSTYELEDKQDINDE